MNKLNSCKKVYESFKEIKGDIPPHYLKSYLTDFEMITRLLRSLEVDYTDNHAIEFISGVNLLRERYIELVGVKLA